MAIEEEDSGCDIPEWVVTFGDMMSLLLTFFIMLVSMSEIKEEEKYQALVDSIRRRFGHTTTMASMVPGPVKPRNSKAVKPASLGRSKRMDTKRGGDKVEAPVGEHPRVRIIRPGTQTAVGTVIFFAEKEVELSAESRTALDVESRSLRGKPQKIEIRGHTSRRTPDAKTAADNWELAFARCRKTMQYLVDQLQIDPARIRMSVAGEHEPLHIGADPDQLRQNPRVEVFLLTELADQAVPGLPEATETEPAQQKTETTQTP